MSPELALAHGFVEEFPVEAATSLEALEPASAAALLAGCAPEHAARALISLSPGFGAECLTRWPDEELPALLGLVGDVSLARLARRLDPAPRERLLSATGPSRGSRLRALMDYPQRSAGSLMDPRPLVLPGRASVADARRQLRPLRDARIGAVYVLAADGRPEGVVSLARLAAADPAETLDDLMLGLPAQVSPLTPASSLLALPGWSVSRELPVVDDVQGLVGVLRLDAVERLEVDDRAVANPAVSVTLALGELYWLMASSLMGAAGRGGARHDESDE